MWIERFPSKDSQNLNCLAKFIGLAVSNMLIQKEHEKLCDTNVGSSQALFLLCFFFVVVVVEVLKAT